MNVQGSDETVSVLFQREKYYYLFFFLSILNRLKV